MKFVIDKRVEDDFTEPVPTHIEIWWDGGPYSSNAWIIATMGIWEGLDRIQIGPAQYLANKPQVMDWIKNYRPNDLPVHLLKNRCELVKIYK